MLDLKSVREEVMELLDEFYTKEEMAEKIEQLVWARLSFFDQRMAEFDQRVEQVRTQLCITTAILPFIVGFCASSMGSLLLHYWNR